MIPDETLQRVLGAAHAARASATPSRGTSSWSATRTRSTPSPSTLPGRRRAFADSLPEDRRKTFDPIKIEGIRESGTGIVVTYDPSRADRKFWADTRSTTPACSRRCSQSRNLWLAAAAENIGVGWVSYTKEYLTDLLGIPAPVRPIAWLCVGKVDQFQEVPDLERFGWRTRRDLSDAIHWERF